MHYVTVEWKHAAPDEPTHFYYELDEDRYECRKIEVYRDGITHSADATHGQGSTFLSWEPHPPLAAVNADSEFCAQEITREDFESVWSQVPRQKHQGAVYA